jgi:pimeloyl-[acyl-carrier protein] methyl ester esterase
MEPLANAIRDADIEVTLLDLPAFDSGTLESCLDALAEQVRPGSWLGGWSLGGMLAVALAARPALGCQGLVTLASNVRFVARDDWMQAMSPAVFEAFHADCREQPETLLRRFALLCSQGAVNPRGLSRLLLVDARPASAGLLAALDALAALDMRAYLSAYRGPRVHIFAERDALVPASAATEMAKISEAESVVLVGEASHALVVEQAQTLAALIASRMEQAHAFRR